MECAVTVISVEEFAKKRYRIVLDRGESFVLYAGELSQYHIACGKALASETYLQIMEKLLPQRAKKRCLNLLQTRPYTEYRLREKLKEGGYPQSVIEVAVDYVKSFGYIDDKEYACQYIFYHKESESRRRMEEKLRSKGISREDLQTAFEESYDSSEEQDLEIVQIQKLLRKKSCYLRKADTKEYHRLYAGLLRKGFHSGSINIALERMNFVQFD